MNITSNYQLKSINSRNTHQQLQTSPSFGMTAKKVAVEQVASHLKITDFIGAPTDLVKKQAPRIINIINLPLDSNGYNKLHRLIDDNDTAGAIEFLKRNPNINLNQRTDRDDSYVGLAFDNDNFEIIKYISNMENYDPTLPPPGSTLHRNYGIQDLVLLMNRPKYQKIIENILGKHPLMNMSWNTSQLDTYSHMRTALDKDYGRIVNLIADMENYNPAVPDGCNITDFHTLCRYPKYYMVAKKLMDKNPDMDCTLCANNDGYTTYLNNAIDSGNTLLVYLIPTMKNYTPNICEMVKLIKSQEYTDVLAAILDRFPDFDINQNLEGYGISMNNLMRIAANFKNKKAAQIIANLKNYNPEIKDEKGNTDSYYLNKAGFWDILH